MQLINRNTDTIKSRRDNQFHQVRIQDLVKGGAPGADAESCRRSEVESRE